MNWAAAAAIIASFGLAVVAALLAYFNNLRLAQRTERLQRISRQLSELYGPLFALALAGERSFDVFRREFRPDIGFRAHIAAEDDPDERVSVAWRSWIGGVFMPLNRRMRDVVLGAADLIEEDEMPKCLLDLSAHVAYYEGLLLAWEREDYSEYWNPLSFPRPELLDYAQGHFVALKREQARRLGKKSVSPSS